MSTCRTGLSGPARGAGSIRDGPAAATSARWPAGQLAPAPAASKPANTTAICRRNSPDTSHLRNPPLVVGRASLPRLLAFFRGLQAPSPVDERSTIGESVLDRGYCPEAASRQRSQHHSGWLRTRSRNLCHSQCIVPFSERRILIAAAFSEGSRARLCPGPERSQLRLGSRRYGAGRL